MHTSERTIVGVFRDRARANLAVEQLKQAGFSEDQIQANAYNLASNTSTAEGIGDGPHIPGVGGESRFVVAVNADGREHEAVGVMVRNGANNSDLPHGMVLEHGSLVNEQGESVNFSPMRDVEDDPGTNTFFGEARDPGHDEDISIMDNPNYPHG
ncbi:MAG: hypothetical protein ACJ788_06805 [Ktedonobacteraceae bacterium]|jgi:hypothetical protein